MGYLALRVGFAYAHPELISKIENRMTGQLNILGMRAAYASYEDMDFQEYTREKNRESLAIFQGMCDELGMRHIKSRANFTFVHTGRPIGGEHEK